MRCALHVTWYWKIGTRCVANVFQVFTSIVKTEFVSETDIAFQQHSQLHQVCMRRYIVGNLDQRQISSNFDNLLNTDLTVPLK
jgi:hypothetical protein